MKIIIALALFISMPLYPSEQSSINSEFVKDGDQQKLGETVKKNKWIHTLITDMLEQDGSRLRQWRIEEIGNTDGLIMIKSQRNSPKHKDIS